MSGNSGGNISDEPMSDNSPLCMLERYSQSFIPRGSPEVELCCLLMPKDSLQHWYLEPAPLPVRRTVCSPMVKQGQVQRKINKKVE